MAASLSEVNASLEREVAARVILEERLRALETTLKSPGLEWNIDFCLLENARPCIETSQRPIP